jgi:hypothetical protein
MSLKIENSRRVAKSRPVCMTLKPVFHLRIFSREAKFSFVFIQLIPDGSS